MGSILKEDYLTFKKRNDSIDIAFAISNAEWTNAKFYLPIRTLISANCVICTLPT